MKVLVVHNSHRSGSSSGDDVVFRKEAELLKRHGLSVITFNSSNDDFERGGIMNKLSSGLQIPWSFSAYRKVRVLLRQEKPDILQVHNFFPLISPSVYYAARSEGIPVIQTLHDFRFLCAMAFFMRDGSICEDCPRGSIIQSVRHGCFKNSRMQTLPVALMLKLHQLLDTFRRNIDAYICLSEHQRKIFSKAGFDEKKLFVKPHFVEDTLKQDGDLQGEYVLFLGRIGEEKGVRTLIEAWRVLPELPLKVVGSGPNEEKYRGLVRTLNLRNVEFLGFRPHEECMAFLDGARFLIMPSICYETFGLTIVEAFSHAKAVIASNLGAMADIVQDGVTGLLFSPRDSEQLAEKVRWLWNNAHEYETMGQNARKEYMAKYTPEKNYEMLMDIYEKAVEFHGRRKQYN